MRKQMFRLKIYLKAIFHSLLQLLVMILFGVFNETLIEMVILYVCFFYFRETFEKQFHANSMWGCTLITILVYWFSSRIIPNKQMSVLLSIIFTYLINMVSFYTRDYLDIKNANKEIGKKKRITSRQMIIRILGEENLDEESIEKFCVQKGAPYLSETIYLFLNNTLEDTADILGVVNSTIVRRINAFIRISLKD